MQPDRVALDGRRDLVIAAKALFDPLEIARLLRAPAHQLAPQQRLRQPHQKTVEPTRHVEWILSVNPSQACQTTSTDGAGLANTLH